MKTYYLFLIAAILAACSKSDSGGTTPPESLTDTVGMVWLVPVNEAQGYDTSGNYIATYDFSKGGGYSTLAYYIASNSSGTHRIRYAGTESLFHPDSVIGRGGSLIDFKINPNLKGKPLFEVYNISSGQIYKRYVASKDSVKIRASFSVFDNYSVPNKKIGEAMLYYINVKQNDGIWYRKSQ
jgi:hypothetical protein